MGLGLVLKFNPQNVTAVPKAPSVEMCAYIARNKKRQTCYSRGWLSLGNTLVYFINEIY